MPVTRAAPQPIVEVSAPPRAAYDFGLFSVLDFGDAERGAVAITWDQYGFLLPTAIQDACLNGASAHTKASTIQCAGVRSTGFSVYSYDTASLIRRNGASGEIANAQLAYAEQTSVEGHTLLLLAENDVAATPVSGTSPYPAKAALATLEARLAERGGKGTIIVSRFMGSLLASGGAVEADGDQLQTKLGTPVAAFGFPYGGSYPDPLLMFGVTGLRGVRGPVTPAVATANSVNDVSAIAERDYSIGFEGDALAALATTTL